MKKFRLEKIEILPEKNANPIYNELESKAHTAYEAEKLFYTCIEQGDTERLSYTMDEFFSNGLVIGKLSENNLRQMQYWAVSCITLAIRYAIEGGLCESEAYEMSDKMIRCVDSMTSSESIPPFLQEKAIELTNLVRYSSIGKDYPPPVRKCISYIKENLEKKLTLGGLSKVCSLSPDYLSALFKKTTGQNISRFILRQKLELSKSLLNGKYDYSEISCYLSFCSESYFIYCFKREYGVTPREYAKALKY